MIWGAEAKCPSFLGSLTWKRFQNCCFRCLSVFAGPASPADSYVRSDQTEGGSRMWFWPLAHVSLLGDFRGLLLLLLSHPIIPPPPIPAG